MAIIKIQFQYTARLVSPIIYVYYISTPLYRPCIFLPSFLHTSTIAQIRSVPSHSALQPSVIIQYTYSNMLVGTLNVMASNCLQWRQTAPISYRFVYHLASKQQPVQRTVIINIIIITHGSLSKVWCAQRKYTQRSAYAYYATSWQYSVRANV